MHKNIKKTLLTKMSKSLDLQERARQSLVSFYTTGPFGLPQYILYFDHGKGSRVVDVDGNEYIDFCMGIGPCLLGHAPDIVVDAVTRLIRTGSVHAMGNEHEVRLAELICECVPCAEAATFVNSGTEATMHALKMARAYTGKDMIAKFEGAYHGVHDYAQISGRSMVKGPPEAPENTTIFAGIPEAISDLVMTLSYNYRESLERIRKHADHLAAVIVEPVPTVCPIDYSAFLKELRDITRQSNVVLIFDEVLSGFRMSLGGAQEAYGIEPDLVTLGKIIGGGLPAGAVAGPKQFMSPLISSGLAAEDVRKKVSITGTFSGNPLTCAAGSAVLGYLKEHKQTVYPRLEQIAGRIRSEVGGFAGEVGFPLQFLGVSSWLQTDFQKKNVTFIRDVNYRMNCAQFELLRRYMLTRGVILGDVPVIFPSLAHTDEDVTIFIEAFKEWIKSKL